MNLNKEISKKFSEMAIFLVETKQVNATFRAKAYRNAIKLLENVNLDLVVVGQTYRFLRSLGLGEKTASKALEIIETGSFTELEDLRKLCAPVDMVAELATLRGVGEKLAARLVARYGFKSMDEVKSMVAAGKVVERTLIKALERAEEKFVKLWPREEVEKTVEPMIEAFKKEFPVVRIKVCGSYLRGKSQIKDVDILICGSSSVGDSAFTNWFVDRVGSVPRVHGKETLEIVTSEGLMIDVRVVPEESWGAGTLFFTGPRDYNISMRAHAKRLGYSLNRYSLHRSSNDAIIASETEEEIFEILGLEYQTPEEREKEQKIRWKKVK